MSFYTTTQVEKKHYARSDDSRQILKFPLRVTMPPSYLKRFGKTVMSLLLSTVSKFRYQEIATMALKDLDRLLVDFARDPNDEVVAEILSRIPNQKQEDKQLIQRMIEILKELTEKDGDLISRSPIVNQLSREYGKKKEALLQKMK